MSNLYNELSDSKVNNIIKINDQVTYSSNQKSTATSLIFQIGPQKNSLCLLGQDNTSKFSG